MSPDQTQYIQRIQNFTKAEQNSQFPASQALQSMKYPVIVDHSQTKLEDSPMIQLTHQDEHSNLHRKNHQKKKRVEGSLRCLRRRQFGMRGAWPWEGVGVERRRHELGGEVEVEDRLCPASSFVIVYTLI